MHVGGWLGAFLCENGGAAYQTHISTLGLTRYNLDRYPQPYWVSHA